jgi:hypothetical protein
VLLPKKRSWAVCYLGGHPLATRSSVGALRFTDDEVVYTGSKYQRLPWNKPERLTIPLRSVVSVEPKAKHELQTAPEGYLNLGIVFHGYGREPTHPMHFGKLEELLILRYTDEHGDEQTLVFANNPWGGRFARKAADAIIAARHRARGAEKEHA